MPQVCDAPYTGATCSQTYASVYWHDYELERWIGVAVGALAVLLTAEQLHRAATQGGSDFARNNFAVLLLAMLLQLAANVDPQGWDAVLPITAANVLANLSTAALYSAVIGVLAFWVAVLSQRPAKVASLPPAGRALCWVGHAAAWVSLALCGVLEVQSPDREHKIRSVKLFACAGLSFVLWASTSLYGFSLVRQVTRFQQLQAAESPRRASGEAAAAPGPAVMVDTGAAAAAGGGGCCGGWHPGRPMPKLIKVMLAAQVAGFSVVAVQTLFALQALHDDRAVLTELPESYPFPTMTLMRYVVWVVLFYATFKRRS